MTRIQRATSDDTNGRAPRCAAPFLIGTLAVLFLLPWPVMAEDADPSTEPSQQERVREAVEDVLKGTLSDLFSNRPGQPGPLAPAPGDVVYSGSGPVVFQWREADKARSYDLQIDCLGCDVPGQWTLAARSEPWMAIPGIRGTFWQVPLAVVAGDFRWRVRGVRGDRDGKWSDWTPFQVASGPQQYQPEPERRDVDPAALGLQGAWVGSNGRMYELAQVAKRFIWSTPDGRETGSALVSADGDVSVEQWTGTAEPAPRGGRIADIDAQGRANRVEWDNGVAFVREGTVSGGEPAAGSAPPSPSTDVDVEPLGWCCLEGTVYRRATPANCDAHGGRFFDDRDEALRSCPQQ